MKEFFEWLLITLQYRKRGAYEAYKRKKKIAGPDNPIRGTWIFNVQKFWWRVWHKIKTGVSDESFAGMCYSVWHHLQIRSENEKTTNFSFGNINIRVAGSTLVLNERWAINPLKQGAYVHERKNKESSWNQIYRTNCKIDDVGFIPIIREAAKRVADHMKECPDLYEDKEAEEVSL